MSTALEKAAELGTGELMLMSLLAGGAGFGGMRLVNDMHQQINPMKLPNNSIKLQLQDPRKHNHHQLTESSDMASANPGLGTQIPGIGVGKSAGWISDLGTDTHDPTWWHKLVAVGLGLPTGFLGAKGIYDKYQNTQYDQKVEEAKKQYTNQLALAQSMNSKVGEEVTPNVDRLCETMANQFEKDAGFIDGIGKGISAFAKQTNLINGIKHGVGLAAGKAGNLAGKAANNWKGLLQLGGGTAGLYGGYKEYKHIHGLNAPYALANGPTAGLPIKLPSDPESVQQANDEVNSNSWGTMKNVINNLSGNVPSAAAATWELGGTGAAAGMLAMLLHNHEKKKEREQKANYPTSIEYAG